MTSTFFVVKIAYIYYSVKTKYKGRAILEFSADGIKYLYKPLDHLELSTWKVL